MRPALCEEALRLGRILAELAPKEPEVHGLVALMEIQASRSRARTGPSGEPILLLDQNRELWDQLLIRRGLAALERAEKLGGACGPYALQAAITACHARVAMAFGAAEGLQIIDTLVSEPSLKSYHLLPSVRGDFLFKLGRFAEARVDFERAVSLTRNAREREFLLERARTCAEAQANSGPR
jgi:predicted RNA polymerase sigma factor